MFCKHQCLLKENPQTFDKCLQAQNHQIFVQSENVLQEQRKQMIGQIKTWSIPCEVHVLTVLTSLKVDLVTLMGRKTMLTGSTIMVNIVRHLKRTNMIF